MRFKPTKSRSLELKKGKVQGSFKFKVAEQVFPTVSEQPIKSLEKWFTVDLSDRESTRTMDTAVEWIERIEKNGLPGKYKVRCYQHGVLLHILWPLLLYNVPMTTIESLGKKTSRCHRRWLGVPKSFSSIGLYNSGSKIQLPISALSGEYKATKAGAVMTLQNS